ncbi:MAG: tRNA pseudouridine(13) synthase TruD [Gammaproteobacteria bacterium]|nr:tRNA pseudouridine(13) synthase TruD [Gammaproteobacteria bacterium]
MQACDISELLTFDYAYGRPTASGILKQEAKDFRVDEVLGFEPSGDGQHRMLQIQKSNTNTEWVAKQLARYVDIKLRDVSYAGLKDRNAITTQWFSIDLAGKTEPDWSDFNCSEYQILASFSHNKKLRRGSLKGNRFEIVIKDLQGDRDELEQRLLKIQKYGVPNYFGPQRFGHSGDNLLQAWMMLQGEKKVKDRNRRGIYLSAARSLIFNQLLSQRVADGSWSQILTGEAVMLAGSSSYFIVTTDDATISQRLRDWDIHPSGPMWGRGELPSLDEARIREAMVCNRFADWLAPLELAGLKQDRRALRLQVSNFSWQWSEQQDLCLQFELVSGSYATSVIRELVLV